MHEIDREREKRERGEEKGEREERRESILEFESQK
jgi:hypothetical protein